MLMMRICRWRIGTPITEYLG
ncbi:hypothetical protein F383_05629 [Gossypium arboreum]|uniref:Uncharacterized protein n=1 Tax=Gossypium arboreum TaxID=29729 RepID=A0A0B0NZ31_GOSAR|nr:hypothetical protein F383_05629 [Gossypium arboreum]